MLWAALLLANLPSDELRRTEALRGLSTWCLQFTPRVAVVEPLSVVPAVVMEVEASLRLFGGKRKLVQRVKEEAPDLGVCQLAWAPTGLAAVALARSGVSNGFSGPLDQVLDALPLGALTSVAEHQSVLARLGCQTLGQIRVLPRGGLSRRFDGALLASIDQAYGLRPEVHAWVELADTFESKVELMSRVDLAPALLFVARRQLLQMSAWLAARQCGVMAFTLNWRHDDMFAKTPGDGGGLTIRTAKPTRDIEHLTRLLAEHLAKVDLVAPVSDLKLTADEVHFFEDQNLSLLPDANQVGESLALVLERVAARLGPDKVLRPVVTEDHRPEWMCIWRPATGKPARTLARNVDIGQGKFSAKHIFDGLAARDPRQQAARIFLFESALLKGTELSQSEWWPTYASGMIVEGITGTGKSQTLDRFLQTLPQVVAHGKRPDCGWQSLKQLVYLKIHMPSDGTRGGFLANGLLELDRVLGTEYFAQYHSGRWTIEKLLVIFLHLLAVHRCGLLIIEESQERNLSQGPFGQDFVTFFLRVLNWGVPTVLVGNPLAFTKLRNFSQDVDRFSEGGWHRLIPHQDHTSDEWTKDWIPSLWQPTLLSQADSPYTPASDDPVDATLAGFIWRRTGGFPRYVCRLRREVQDVALRRGVSTITPALVDQVYRTSPKMVELHERINAFTSRDWRALQRFDDIPVSFFRRLWEPEPEATFDGSLVTAKTVASKDPKQRKTSTKSNGKTKTSSATQLQVKLAEDIARASAAPKT